MIAFPILTDERNQFVFVTRETLGKFHCLILADGIISSIHVHNEIDEISDIL